MKQKRKEKENIKKLLRGQTVEIKRHMSVLGEEYQSRLQVVGELVTANSEKLTALDEKVAQNSEKLTVLDQKVTILDGRMQVLQQDMEFVKSSLKRKVDYDEFTALSRRVSRLEARIK